MMTQVISMQISDHKCACLSVCLRMYVHIYLSIHLSVFLPNTLNQMQKLKESGALHMLREVPTYIRDLSYTISIHNLLQPIDATIVPATKLEPKTPVGRHEWSSNELKQ